METPKCLAIIVCESVVEDMRSHNKCILNTYNTIWAHQFPTKQDRMTVFASLTNGRGAMDIEVRFVKDQEDAPQKTLINLRGEVGFPSPLDVVDLTMDLRNVPIPEAGSYAIQIWINQEPVGERRIAARPIEKGKAKP